MLPMRVRIAVTLIALGIAGVDGASAADLPIDRAANNYVHYSAAGRRAGPLMFYDNDRGVVMRAYWLAPWRNRHYYPTTGEKPEIGRDEDLSAPRGTPEPAETFYRFWSTSSAFVSEEPQASARPRDDQAPNKNDSEKP
jgi:hypothetical protein